MSKVLKTQSSGLGLTVADTFRETFDDEETGAAGHFEDHPTSTSTAAASSKPRYRWVLAGTAALLVVLGVSVGLATRNNSSGSDGPSSASVADSPAAVPTVPDAPEAPSTPAAEVVAIKPSDETAREPTDSAGDDGSFDPVPEVSVGDAALLNFGDVVEGTAGPSGSPVTDAPTMAPTDEPTASPSAAPSAPPSQTPTHGPSASPTTSEPTKQPTPPPSSAPTSEPTNKPTFPDLSSWSNLDWGQFDPSAAPSKGPTSEPTSEPTSKPTSEPTTGPSASPTTAAPTTEAPTASPTGPFFFGDEFDAYPDLGAGGLHVSTGLSIRLIARTGRPVPYANGDESNDDFHSRADAAGIIFECPETPTECGYAYVSNSEEGDGGGGVHAIYFDKDANILEYKSLLTKTTDNCGGGLTPWNTFVSCEEFSDGQCWQVDPYAERAEETKLGGSGGRYESVAVDNRQPENPVFFTTEDDEFGALRRFVADGNGWECLHNDPAEEERFLNILDGDTFEWTTDEDEGRESAADHFPNTEGIQFHEGKLYFMAKKIHKLFILDVDNMTYTTEGTGKKFYGEGSFGDQPDQNMFGPTRKYMYFTEDGGTKHGVYARYHDGTYFTLFEAMGDGPEDETVGIALSPDHRRLYAGIQDSGYIFEVTRDDGLPFE